MALYDSDSDGIRFHVQLETLSEYCKEIIDTGSVHTVTKVLINLEVRNHLCEVYKVAKLIMVMLATNSLLISFQSSRINRESELSQIFCCELPSRLERFKLAAKI